MKPTLRSFPLIALTLFAGCARHHESEAAAAASLPPAKVRIATVRIEEIPMPIEVTGAVRPLQHAMIAAKVMGAINELPFTLGQRFHAGELLVRISADEISARVVQARTQLKQSQRDLAREQELFTRGASTSEMVKNLEDRFAMTQAMLNEAEVMLGYTMVRAPFDGVIARKLADTGAFASPGVPLLEIEGSDAFQIEAGIPDSLVTGLKSGAEVSVNVPAAGATFSGALVEISSVADAYAHTVSVKISVPAGETVRSGQFARIQIPGAPIRALMTPATAVSMLGQMERVFVVRDSRATLRLVKTGAARGAQVEILSGLSDGDQVIINPAIGLREGQPLEVMP